MVSSITNFPLKKCQCLNKVDHYLLIFVSYSGVICEAEDFSAAFHKLCKLKSYTVIMNKEELLNDKEFLKSFKNGEDLTHFFKKIHKRAVEHMLEAELDAHLDNEKHQKTKSGNYRNGYGSKKIKSSFGEAEIKVPRNREGNFEPALVPKRHNIINGLENIIISFYAKGMSVNDIEEQIREMYDFDVSTSAISRITNAVTTEMIAWQNHPLDDLYLIVWMDGIVFKVREKSKVINKTIYLAIGLIREGKKEVLGMWLGKNESSSF